MSPHLPLGPGAEFDRIRAFAKELGKGARDWGDDCALLELGGGTTLALSIDASVEGVHFRRDWLSPEEIGWRAGAAALSDLAAEGAEAVGVLVTLGLPAAEPAETGVALMRGIAKAAQSVGGAVLGGDLSRSDHLFIDVCAVGKTRRPVRRSGAQAGDALWLTGHLGGPRSALSAWSAGKAPRPEARARFAHPEPRVAAGLALAESGARAMIDVSDGLAADAGHLAAASGVAMVIAAERIPMVEGVEVGEALGSGEEYELLVAMPATFSESNAIGLAHAVEVRLTRIGHVEAGSGVRILDHGRPVAPPKGWDHFAPPPPPSP